MKRLIPLLILSILFFVGCDTYNKIMKKSEPIESEISEDVLSEILGEPVGEKPKEEEIMTIDKKELKKIKREQRKQEKIEMGDTLNLGQKFWYALFPKTIERELSYPLIYKEKPRSILVLYPWNWSKREDAGDIFLINMTRELSLKGYYVPSVLKSFSDYKADTMFSAKYIKHSDAKALGEEYGVDAVLYSTIYSLNKNWWSTAITSSGEFFMISTKTEDTLFFRKTEFIYDTPKPAYKPSKKSEVFNMDMTREVPFFGLGHQMCKYVFIDIPFGPYHKKYMKDQKKFSHPQYIDFKINMRLDY